MTPFRHVCIAAALAAATIASAAAPAATPIREGGLPDLLQFYRDHPDVAARTVTICAGVEAARQDQSARDRCEAARQADRGSTAAARSSNTLTDAACASAAIAAHPTRIYQQEMASACIRRTAFRPSSKKAW